MSGFVKKKGEQKSQRPDKPKQSRNAYLQQGVGHTGGPVSSPLCFLVQAPLLKSEI